MSKILNSSLLDGVSVIICCYNSEWIIVRCLEALKAQIVSEGFLWEVILVDNNCTDNTVSVALETMSNSNVQFNVVAEPNAGLMNARKRGIANAKYRYCIYCDDDNLLSPNYVEYMYNLLADHAEIGAAGGKGIAEFECEPDPSIMNYLTGYAVGSQIEHPGYLFGAGLALRTEVVRTIFNEFPSTLVGRQGGKLLSGDDLELVNYVKLMGYKLCPTDDVEYIHVLKANRLTEEYRLKMFEGLMLALPVGDMMTMALEDKKVSTYLIGYFKSEVILLLRSMVFWSKHDLTPLRNFVQRVRYWGILKLLSVYTNSKIIKKKYTV